MPEEIPTYDIGREIEAGIVADQSRTKLIIARTLLAGVILAEGNYFAERINPSLVDEQVQTVVATPEPVVTDIEAARSTYPSLGPNEWDPESARDSIVDYNETNEHTVVHRYPGLEGISFAQPSFETNLNIDAAQTPQELQDAIDPFFADLGIDFHVTGDNPLSDHEHYVPIGQEQVDLAKYFTTNIIQVLAKTPRELLQFSEIQDIYLPYKYTSGDEPGFDALGYAVRPDDRRGIVLIVEDRESYDYKEVQNTTEHEIGHHVGERLNVETNGGFQESVDAANPSWFMYRNEITTLHQAIEAESTLIPLANELQVSTDYGMTNWNEDNAETFELLNLGDATPDPRDFNFPLGTPVYDKKVTMIESIDHFVPGYKQWMIGNDTLYMYDGHWIPTHYDPRLEVVMGNKLLELLIGDKYNKFDSGFADWSRAADPSVFDDGGVFIDVQNLGGNG